jgi:putative flippase GtrA
MDTMFSDRQVILQFLRYAIVGMVSNLTLYAMYLIATGFGVGPKIAITVVYGLGVLQTFLFNKRWSFDDQGPEGAALVRYCIAYASGYALNYLILVVFVDYLGLAHQYVQGVAILLVALYLFALQRVWVFRRLAGARI